MDAKVPIWHGVVLSCQQLAQLLSAAQGFQSSDSMASATRQQLRSAAKHAGE